MFSLALLILWQVCTILYAFRQKRFSVLTFFFLSQVLFQFLPFLIASLTGKTHVPPGMDLSPPLQHFALAELVLAVGFFIGTRVLRVQYLKLPINQTTNFQKENPFFNVVQLLFLFLPVFSLLPNPTSKTAYFVFSPVIVLNMLSKRASGFLGIGTLNFFILNLLPFLYFIRTGQMFFYMSILVCIALLLVVSREKKLLYLAFTLFFAGVFVNSIKPYFRTGLYNKSSSTFQERTQVAVTVAKEEFVHVKRDIEIRAAAATAAVRSSSSLTDAKSISPNIDSTSMGRKFFEGARNLITPIAALFSRGVLQICGRSADASFFWVYEYTPSKVPFWNGRTYKDIPYRLIPGVFREVTLFVPWNEFGRKYGILDDFDYETSVAFNYLTEGYMNYGFWGLYLVATIVGLLFAGIQWILVNWKSNSIVLHVLLLQSVFEFSQPLGSILHVLYHRIGVMVILTLTGKVITWVWDALPQLKVYFRRSWRIA